MSYILDALKRAESERSRGAVPNIHAQPALAGGSNGDEAVVGWLTWTVVVTVFLVLAAAGWWWTNQSATPAEPSSEQPVLPSSMPQVPSPSAVPLKPVAPAMVTPAPSWAFKPPPTDAATKAPAAAVAAVPVVRPVAQPMDKASKAMAPASASPLAAEERVYAVKDLPNDIRSLLPAVTVGGASYSESPASRMLIINGQIYHEGDRLTPDLTLQQIKLRTAVLSFRGYRYAISY